MSAAKRNPFAIGVISKSILILGVLLLLSIVMMAGSLFYAATQQGYQRQYLELISEQKLLSQRLATLALESATGKERAFITLEQSRDRYDETLKIFKSGNPRTGLPAIPKSAQRQFRVITDLWYGEDSDAEGGSYRQK